jgi:hypothetical protein
MSVTSLPRPSRPTTAPAYYLGRPASVWIAATTSPAEPSPRYLGYV